MELFDEYMGESFAVTDELLAHQFTDFKIAVGETVASVEVIVGSYIREEMSKIISSFNKEFEEAINEDKKDSSNTRCMLWLVNHLKLLAEEMTKSLRVLYKNFLKASSYHARQSVRLVAKKEILIFVNDA